jgi:hypothetical protein
MLTDSSTVFGVVVPPEEGEEEGPSHHPGAHAQASADGGQGQRGAPAPQETGDDFGQRRWVGGGRRWWWWMAAPVRGVGVSYASTHLLVVYELPVMCAGTN